MPMQPLTETDWKSLTGIESFRSPIACVGQHARLGSRRVEQQYAELVTAETGDEVRGVGEANLQSICNGAQQHVAGRVPEPVVDRLEVVEVEEQHRRKLTSLQLVADSRQEVGAIGEARQRIVIGAVAELALQRAIRGHVTQCQHDAGDGDVRHQVDRRQLHRAPLAVGVQHRTSIVSEPSGGRFLTSAHSWPAARRWRGCRASSNCSADPVVALVAEHRLQCWTGVRDPAIAVDEHRRHRTSARRATPDGRCRGVR